MKGSKMSEIKLTPKLLKRIIDEEVSKFGDMEETEDAAKETDEVGPDEYADALEKHIDYVKALKIEESRLIKRLKTVKEAKVRVLKKIASNVS